MSSTYNHNEGVKNMAKYVNTNQGFYDLTDPGNPKLLGNLNNYVQQLAEQSFQAWKQQMSAPNAMGAENAEKEHAYYVQRESGKIYQNLLKDTEFREALDVNVGKAPAQSYTGEPSKSGFDIIPGQASLEQTTKYNAETGEYANNQTPDFKIATSGKSSGVAGQIPTKLPSGILIKEKGGNNIYLIDGNTKRRITNMETLNALPIDKKYWTEVDMSHLDMPNGPEISNLMAGAIKPKTEAISAINSTGINWQEARGYKPTNIQQQMSDFVNYAKSKGFQVNPTTGEVINPTPELIAEFNNKFSTNIPSTNNQSSQPATPAASAQPPAPALLPKDLADKYYQAYGKVPGAEDVTVWQNYPELFTKQLDDAIATKNINKPGDTGTPIFAGGSNGALVKFSEDPDGAGPQNTSTVYWVDPTTKALHPIMSEAAFKARYGKTVQQAMVDNQINTVPVTALQDGGSLAGFNLLTNDYGIQNDGTFKPYEPGVNTNAAVARYGKEPMARQELIDNVLKPLEGVLTALKNDPKSGVTPALIDEIMNNQDLMLKYTSALAYGGYWLPDIYRDIKRQQLVKSGRADLANVKVIDENKNANTFYSSPEGSAIRTNPDLTPPASIGNLDMGMLNNPIFSIPSDIYKVLVPTFDPTTPEGKAELESIKAAWYDVQSQIANAQTEQAHEVARYNYLQFQKELNQNYGITLSDNANEAWNQINSLGNTAQERGLSNSGVANEATDQYLQDRRKIDERLRTEKLTKEQEQKRQYLLQSGTPEEIAALSDVEKARYGFQPSSEAKLFFTDENLKKLYPDLSDDEIKQYKSMVIDENGNYRSTLYQTLFKNQYDIGNQKKQYQLGTFTVDPTTGRVTGGYGVLYQRALDEERKYLPYTKAESFSKPQDSGTSSTSGSSAPAQAFQSPISTFPSPTVSAQPSAPTSMLWETPSGSTYDLKKYTNLTGQEAVNWANNQDLLRGGKLKVI